MEQFDTGTDELLATREGSVGVITLNRPESHNALSSTLMAGLRRALDYCESDPDTRVLVLTARGPVFCAGADLNAVNEGKTADGSSADATPEERIRSVQEIQEAVALRLYEFPKPTIAALPGVAAGAGFSLALSTDLRIATRNAFFATAFAKVGLSGDLGLNWLLTRLIGPSKAKELLYTSRKISADDALALGVLNLVCEDDELESVAMTMAREIALAAPIALQCMKEIVNKAGNSDLRTSLILEADRVVRCMESNDHKEGVRAFLEKREPQFQGD